MDFDSTRMALNHERIICSRFSQTLRMMTSVLYSSLAQPCVMCTGIGDGRIFRFKAESGLCRSKRCLKRLTVKSYHAEMGGNSHSFNGVAPTRHIKSKIAGTGGGSWCKVMPKPITTQRTR